MACAGLTGGGAQRKGIRSLAFAEQCERRDFVGENRRGEDSIERKIAFAALHAQVLEVAIGWHWYVLHVFAIRGVYKFK